MVSADFPYLGQPIQPNHNFSSYTPLGGNRYTEYAHGETPYNITQSIIDQSDAIAKTRLHHIKNAMKHAWDGYQTYAFGHDELLPQSKHYQNNWDGMAVTLVDSLDTLWLMDLKDEFWQGRDWIEDHLDHDVDSFVSTFETTIRSLGGLLSAYDLSGDDIFLKRADDLGSRLLKAFDSPSGIPYGQVNLKSGEASNLPWIGGKLAILSEFGTLQVEFRYLAEVTGNIEYAEKAERVFELMKEIEPPNGLYPYFVDNTNDKPSFGTENISFGSFADSKYEYMLKIWLQGGKVEKMYREMWDKSVQGMHDVLLQRSFPSGLRYIAEIFTEPKEQKTFLNYRMDHLACFMGGALALGAYTDPLELESWRAQRDLQTAKALAYTCYQMYAQSISGLSPEAVKFNKSHGNEASSTTTTTVATPDFKAAENARYYILRPETVETFYILHHLTKEPVYREWGWEIFQSIECFCRTDVAYGSLRDVSLPKEGPEDRMESFFLAETLKYFYLLFNPDDELDLLSKHVFNTEAHPIRTFPDLDKQQSDRGQCIKTQSNC